MDANGFRAKRDAVRSLIETAQQYVSIRHSYLDRGFYQVHIVSELEELGVDYIMRARPSSGMKYRLSAGTETVTDEYTMRRKRKTDGEGRCHSVRGSAPPSDDEHI